MNASSRWRREVQSGMEYFAKLLDLPTRSEINSLMQRLSTLENRLRDSATGTPKAAAEKTAAERTAANAAVVRAASRKRLHAESGCDERGCGERGCGEAGRSEAALFATQGKA